MIAQAMTDQIAVTAQRGKRITAVSNASSRIDQCIDDQADGDDSDLQQFARGKNRVAMRMSAEHSAQHSTGDREIGRSKKYPGDANRAVSGEPSDDRTRAADCQPTAFVSKKIRITRSITR